MNKLKSNCGLSLVEWTVVFAVVVAGVFFIRVPLRRALQGKITATADYLFWTNWFNPATASNWTPQQYKGDINSFSKSHAEQVNYTRISEKDAHRDINIEHPRTYPEKHPRKPNQPVNYEETVSSGVEEGAEPLLKTFDLNQIVR